MSIRIDSLTTTEGYLQDAPVTFAPGLTCVIGARGTCKSTLVETLRFAFDCNHARVAVLLAAASTSQEDAQPFRGLIHETLGNGSVCCRLSQQPAEDAASLTIDRHVAAAPRLYRDGIVELTDRTVFDCIEIYSQGDLQRIAERDELRLELIDRPNKAEIDTLKQKRAEHGRTLMDLGRQLRAARGDIETRRTDQRGLEQLRGQLAQLQADRPILSRELDAERAAYLARKDLCERIQAAADASATALASLMDAARLPGDLDALARDLAVVTAPEAAALVDHLRNVADLVLHVRADCEAAHSFDAASLVQAVQRACEEQNANYYRLRQEQQAVNETLRREDALKQQIAHLEKVERDLDALQQQESRLLHERRACREAIQQIGDRIFRLRLYEVEAINQRHSDVVVLTLEQGARSSDYARSLATLLQGSRLRGQDDVAQELARRVRPADLIDIVESSDAQRLADILSRDLGQMARLLSFLMDAAGLYELEGAPFEDRLEITMYVDGVAKPINQLSRGQMATALLPLILRPAPYPLVVDQPEDDLDNRFIFTTLVQRVRELKRERQLIFVTHNANIPVLGDADAVIVMQMASPIKAAPPECGTVDAMKGHILSLLEGGADAFNRRHAKYGDLLS